MSILETPQEIAENYDFLTENQVLTLLCDCSLGVIDKGIKGYTKTYYKIKGSYNEAREAVQQANLILHPSKSIIEIARISLSSF